MKNKCKIWGLVAGAAVALLGVVTLTSSVFANTAVEGVLSKVYSEGIFTCYKSGVMKSNLGKLNNYSTPLYSLINEDKNEDSSVPLVTGYAAENSVKCSELLFGQDYSSWSYWHDGEVLDGLFLNWPNGDSSAFGGTEESPEADQKAYLLKLGYEETAETIDSGKCVRFRFSNTDAVLGGGSPETGTYTPPVISDDVLVYSSKICAELNGSDGIKSLSVENATDDFIKFEVLDNTGGKIDSDYSDRPIALRMYYVPGGTTDTSIGDFFAVDRTFTVFTAENHSFNQLIDLFLEEISIYDFLRPRDFNLFTAAWYYLVASDPIEETQVTTRNETYALSSNEAAAAIAMKSAYPSFASYSDIAFTVPEEIALYTYYLNSFYNVEPLCDPSDHSIAAMGDKWVKVQIYQTATGTMNNNCYVEKPSNASSKVNGLNSSKHFGTAMDFNGVVAALNAITPEDLEDEDLSEVPGFVEEVTSGSADASVSPTCFNAASSLGWILCPVIEGTGKIVEGIYEIIEQEFLVTDPYSMSSTSATAQGWQTFRDFANIIFAILFVIVIFSQITGVGISNYGIKKALPRLIMVAVLVNLSFIICQASADLSNILGDGLKTLFDGFANNVTMPTDANGDPLYAETIGNFTGGLVSTLMTVGAGAGAVYLAAVTWEYWLIPLLLFLLGAVISVIFFAIVLGVRRAGVIILTVLAPIAIVCYALPNTKKMFDRWLKIYTALLMVYPLSGLLMGGGMFASKLILATAAGSSNANAGFFIQLVAMLLQVVPFFFIPSLVRGSMSALGNLGAKISGLGSRLSNSAAGAIKRSERVQDWNRRNQTNTQYRRAQRLENRIKGRGGTLSAGQARRVARAKAAFEKQGVEDVTNRHYADRTEAEIATTVAAAEHAYADKEVKAMEDEIKMEKFADGHAKAGTKVIDDTSELESRYRQALLANDTMRIKAYQNVLTRKGDDGREAVHRAVTAAEAAGASRAALQTHASNLVNNHAGDYKPNSRSTFNHANGILAGRTDAMSHYENASSLVGSVKDETLGNMDDQEFERLKVAAATDTAAQQKLYEAAYDAINNDSAMAGVKQDRKDALRQLAAHSTRATAVPVPTSSGDSSDSIHIDHGGTPPAPAAGGPGPAHSAPTTSSAPIPNGATVTDSGIVIAPNDMSGEQIRRYAEDMRRFNNSQNNNGGQSGNGPTIILPH